MGNLFSKSNSSMDGHEFPNPQVIDADDDSDYEAEELQNAAAAAAYAEARRIAEIERRALRQEQDDAYQESLRIDQEKDRIKREQKEAELEKERSNKRKREEEEDRLEKLMEKKVSVRANLKPEPPQDHANSIRILLRFPNGQRVERRFLIEDSLNDLHDFVLSHPDSPEFFQLATTFPRRRLPFPHEHEESNENKKEKTDENVNDKKEVEGDEHGTGTDGGGDIIGSGSMSSESPTFASFGILKNEVIYVFDLEP